MVDVSALVGLTSFQTLVVIPGPVVLHAYGCKGSCLNGTGSCAASPPHPHAPEPLLLWRVGAAPR